MYSPIMPSIISNNPPTKATTPITELQPIGTSELTILLITMKIKYMKLMADKQKPIPEDILKGFTENAVKPFIHKDNNFLKL